MKQFKVIDQLSLIDGVLMCKRPSGRSYQKAHYKQGDLDGACGAYSLSRVLNILGVFEADELLTPTNKQNKRTDEWKLIKALNQWGLYRDGLKSSDIRTILKKYYSDIVSVYIPRLEKNGKDVPEKLKYWIDQNTPVILGINYNSEEGHWIVAVGYALDENYNYTSILTLDPGADTPRYCLWNGIIELDKEPRKKYGYRYYSDKADKTILTDEPDKVSLDEIIVITRN